MKMFRAYLPVICLFFLCGAWTASADGGEGQTVILNRETIRELALKNYLDIQLAQLNVKASQTELNYVYSKQDEANKAITGPTASRLPVTAEEFLAQIPEYDKLSDEQKVEIDQAIRIQGMINESFNQFINAQNSEQYRALLREQSLNLVSLNDNVRSVISKSNLAKLELDKTKQLVGYYAIQQYTRILSAKNNIASLELEADHLIQNVEDTRHLLKLGLASQAELSEAQSSREDKQAELEQMKTQYNALVHAFTANLGISKDQTLLFQLLEVDVSRDDRSTVSIHLDDNYDLRKINEEIRSARASYDELLTKDRYLADFHLSTWYRKNDEKELLRKQLDRAMKQMEYEEQSLHQKIGHLEKKFNENLQLQRDRIRLAETGQVAHKQLEDINLAVNLMRFQLDNAKLEYYMFQEKKQLALNGVVLLD